MDGVAIEILEIHGESCNDSGLTGLSIHAFVRSVYVNKCVLMSSLDM